MWSYSYGVFGLDVKLKQQKKPDPTLQLSSVSII